MRKFILITAMVLISATAQAGSRGLTLASNDEPAVAQQPQALDTLKATDKATEAPKTTDTPAATSVPAEAPKYVERPPAVDVTTEAPKADQLKPALAKKAENSKRRRESTEARVIYELHRHGIYW